MFVHLSNKFCSNKKKVANLNIYHKDLLFIYVSSLRNLIIAGDFNGHNLFWESEDNTAYGDMILDKVVSSNHIYSTMAVRPDLIQKIHNQDRQLI
jgi:uncharacterized ferritin-like protein (DUF455 family)